MGRSSQRKGAGGERELAKLLKGYGCDVRRGGALSVGREPDLVGLPGIHVEVKRAERLNLPEAVKQSRQDSDRFNDGLPAVFHRRNRGEWLVTMPLDAWMIIYQKSQAITATGDAGDSKDS